MCPAQGLRVCCSLCLGQSSHLLRGVAHFISSVTPRLVPSNIPTFPDSSAYLSANHILLITPFARHLALCHGWKRHENRAFVCFAHCGIIGARTGLGYVGGSVPACWCPQQPSLGHREASKNKGLSVRLGVRQGWCWRGELWGGHALWALAGLLPGCCALAKLSCPLDKPRNVHRQTCSFPASLPLGGASCTHTQFGE